MNLDTDGLEVYIVLPGTCTIKTDRPLAVIELPLNISNIQDEMLSMQDIPRQVQINIGFKRKTCDKQGKSQRSGFSGQLKKESFVTAFIKDQLAKKLKKTLKRASDCDGLISDNAAVPFMFNKSFPNPQIDRKNFLDGSKSVGNLQEQLVRSAPEESKYSLGELDSNTIISNKGGGLSLLQPNCTDQNLCEASQDVKDEDCSCTTNISDADAQNSCDMLQDIEEKEDCASDTFILDADAQNRYMSHDVDEESGRVPFVSNVEVAKSLTQLSDFMDMSTDAIMSLMEVENEQNDICTEASSVKGKPEILLEEGTDLKQRDDFTSGRSEPLLPVVGCGTSSSCVKTDKSVNKNRIQLNTKVYTENFYTFTQVPLLELYKDSYLGDNTWKCNVCNNICNEKLLLQQCIQSHNICDVCGKKFTDRTYLQQHTLLDHTGSKNLRCLICNKDYLDERVLNHHVSNIHGIKKSHVCMLCGKEFKNAGKLKSHRLVHTGKRPYSCDLCKQSFQTSGQIKPHLRAHMGETPFKCELCGKSFTSTNKLNTHKKTHPGGKLHQCSTCMKEFYTKPLYEAHIKLHYRESMNKTKKELSSKFSTHNLYSFTQVPILELFKDSYLGDNTWKCNVCNKVCKDKVHLQHCIQSHNICDVCGKKFTDKKTLKDHIVSQHTEKGNFRCHICKKKYVEERGLNYHLSRVHGIKPCHVCDLCGKKFAESGRLKNHRLVHTGEMLYSCDLCNHRFQTSGQVMPHLRTHTGEAPYKCELCGKLFTSKNYLRSHKKSHPGGKLLECLICRRKFYTRPLYQAHMKLHNLERAFEVFQDITSKNCPIVVGVKDEQNELHVDTGNSISNKTSDASKDSDNCQIELSRLTINETPTVSFSRQNKKTTSKTEADTKVNTKDFFPLPLQDFYKDSYQGDNKWKCNVCNNICKGKLYLQRCIQSHNICDVCGKKFSLRANLLHHINNTHTQNKSFLCHICNKGFQVQKSLHYHFVVIHGIKLMHVCEYCGKEFKTGRRLRDHHLVHTGEKPYSCDLCGLRLQTSGQVKPHLRRHTGEKPYQCEICGKSFAHTAKLTLHKQIHASERTHLCPICGKGFYTKRNCRMHLKVHSEEKPFECKTCGRRFKRKAHLHSHTDAVHEKHSEV